MFRPAIVLCALSVLAAGAVAFPSDPPATGASGDLPAATVHPDPEATEAAMLDAYRAVLRDDVEALAVALDALRDGCRVLDPEGPERLGPLRGIDRGYHVAYQATVDAAAAGDVSAAADQYHWMTVGCRRCHVVARKNGLLPNRPLMRRP